MTPPETFPAARAVAEVEARLDQLWYTTAQGRAVPQACTLNLLVATGETLDPATQESIDEVVSDLLARTLVVRLSPGQGPNSVGVSVTSTRPTTSSGPVVVPRVDLWIGDEMVDRSFSLVMPLLGLRMSSVLFLPPGAKRELAQALMPLGHQVVTDCGRDLDLALWAAAHSDRGFVDFAFLRGVRWRELVARFFDDPTGADAAFRVNRVHIVQATSAAGRAVEGSLLIAWLGSRLGWRPEPGRILDRNGAEIAIELRETELPEAAPGSLQRLELVAAAAGQSLTGKIQRESSGERLSWSLRVGDTMQQIEGIAAALPTSTHLVARALGTRDRDPATADTLRWLGRWQAAQREVT